MHNSNMAKILILNGPNLNMLGTRELETYGSESLASIISALEAEGKGLNHEITSLQSNAEHELIDTIQQARGKIDFIIINPGAFTHTSIAIRDAFLAVEIPFIEIHLSNVLNREPFRHRSYLADIAIGIISGFGAYGYQLALNAANHYLKTHELRSK